MAYLYSFLQIIVNNSYFLVILSAFFGGLFAGLFSTYFESKRRVSDKRRDKYYDHRNTIVQIEHELIPARLNISRNINSLIDSLENTNESNKRIILRLFRLKISPNLSLNLLNLDLINLYAQVFEQFETINNNIDYMNQTASTILEDKKSNRIDENLINLYIQFTDYLLSETKIADQKSLELVAYCKLVLAKSEGDIVKRYISKGNQIKYNLGKRAIKNAANKIVREETKPYKRQEVRPKFIAPFLDLKRVVIHPSTQPE